MKEREIAGVKRRYPMGAQWIIFLGAAVSGFSLAFLHPLTHASSAHSIFSAPTWIDGYWSFMTHPFVRALFLVYALALFVRERAIAMRTLLAGLVGWFAGSLVYKLLT